MNGNYDRRLIIPVVIFLAFIITPIFYVFFKTLLFGNANILNSLNFPRLFSLLSKSLFIAFSSATLSTVFGILFGLIVFKTRTKIGTKLFITLLLPLFVPSYVIAVGWRNFFFSLGFPEILSNSFGLIFIYLSIFTPLSVLVIGNAFTKISPSIEESALLITNTKSVIIKILIPLVKHAIITSFVLVFVFVVSEFSVPAFLGVKVFATEIFTEFSAFYNHDMAIVQSLLIVVIAVVLLSIENNYLLESPFLSINSSGLKTKKYNFLYGGKIIWFWVLFVILLPFFSLVKNSLKNGLNDYLKAFELLFSAMLNSFFLSLLGAISVVFAGLLFALFLTKVKISFIEKGINFSLLVLFAIPSIILGITISVFYNNSFLNFIYNNRSIIIIAYLSKYSFIGVKIIGNSLKQIPKSFEETAVVLGISFSSRLTKIILPLLKTSIFFAFVIVFVLSFSELGTTIMIYPPGLEILPIKIFTLSANLPNGIVSAMISLSLIITVLLISVFYFLFTKFFNNHTIAND